MKFSFPDCGGCRSCELACSYRLANEFDPKASAIEIVEKKSGGYDVIFHEEVAGQRHICDGCPDLEDPMCARYCHSAAELMEYIDDMRKRIKSKEVTEND